MSIILGSILFVVGFVLGIFVTIPFFDFIQGNSDPTTKEVIQWIVLVVIEIIIVIILNDAGFLGDNYIHDMRRT